MTSLEAVAVVASPIGQIAIGCTDAGLAQLDILANAARRRVFTDSKNAGNHCAQVQTQLIEYFAGERKHFDVQIDISGTNFQHAVWRVIAATKFGERVSYGQIADRIAKPTAARAVGGAVGANPIPIVIGCHRVLGSGHSVTGYSGGEGIRTKLWLLEHEGIEYRA